MGGKITEKDHRLLGDQRSWLEIPEDERIKIVRQFLKDNGMLTRKNGFVK